MSEILNELAEVLEQRKNSSPEDSYVASLHSKGLNKILEKVGEEATETILAAKDAEISAEHKKALVSETADLWFHTMVMLSHVELNPNDVLNELKGRFNLSGHVEKASRNSSQ